MNKVGKKKLLIVSAIVFEYILIAFICMMSIIFYGFANHSDKQQTLFYLYEENIEEFINGELLLTKDFDKNNGVRVVCDKNLGNKIDYYIATKKFKKMKTVGYSVQIYNIEYNTLVNISKTSKTDYVDIKYDYVTESFITQALVSANVKYAYKGNSYSCMLNNTEKLSLKDFEKKVKGLIETFPSDKA